MTAAQDSRAQLRERAIALYTPPFRYEHGYIFDANGHMVADDCGENEGAATRVRGWGRIGYMENPAALQDEVGALVAELLTAHWQASRAALSAEPVAWEPVAELCAEMCESRSRSLSKDGAHTAANEAAKCASVLRNPPDGWREKLDAAARQPAAQERKPLTDAQIDALWGGAESISVPQRINRRGIARSIERAHGID